MPRGAEHWTIEEWALFRTCHPDFNERFSVSFNGDFSCNDYEGDCSWDGVSRRCDCGNRRVSWSFDGSSVYAEAY